MRSRRERITHIHQSTPGEAWSTTVRTQVATLSYDSHMSSRKRIATEDPMGDLAHDAGLVHAVTVDEPPVMLRRIPYDAPGRRKHVHRSTVMYPRQPVSAVDARVLRCQSSANNVQRTSRTGFNKRVHQTPSKLRVPDAPASHLLEGIPFFTTCSHASRCFLKLESVR